MSVDQIKALLAEYAATIDAVGATDRIHMSWMASEMTTMLDTVPTEPLAREAHLFKLNRWLGFLQRTVSDSAGRSIEQLRNDTRGIDAVLSSL